VGTGFSWEPKFGIISGKKAQARVPVLHKSDFIGFEGITLLMHSAYGIHCIIQAQAGVPVLHKSKAPLPALSLKYPEAAFTT
jgi:hypothetical protein